METVPNLETVYQGIHTLYNDPQPSAQQKAAKWLEEVQKSVKEKKKQNHLLATNLTACFSSPIQVYSWKIADEILQQRRDIESCSFAAQTMRNKIQNSFHELPPESRESLRDALLIHISQITQLTNKVIVTHLCLALADLALLMSAWRNPVLDLIDKFSNRPDLLAPLLEILTLLPEEVNSRYLRLGANRRDEIVKELEANANAVHEFLCQCVTTANSAQQQHQAGDQQRAALPFDPDTIQTWAVKCFTSWVSVSAIQVSYFSSSIQSKESISMRKQNVNNLPPFSGNFLLLISLSLSSLPQVSDISDNVIVSLVFSKLSRDPFQSIEVHDMATDCLTILLQWVEMCPGNPLLEMQLFTCVMELEKAFQEASSYEQIEATMNYCRIFTHTAEAFMTRITSREHERDPHYSLKVFDLILKCIACYDYDVARITFNLWYRLSEELYQKDSAELTAQFKPYIEQLITELTRHSQMDPDHEGLIDEQGMLHVSRRRGNSI